MAKKDKGHGKGKPWSDEKSVRTFCYVAGSVAACVAACAIVPKVISHIAGMIDKRASKAGNARRAGDDWGPVIERRHPEAPKEG